MSLPIAIVVDDDLSLGKFMTTALMLAGFDAEHISDSRLALARIRQRQPVLIFLDYNMPHVTGVELLKAIRADEQTRHIKVIVATANSMTTSDRVIEELADLLLLKPVSLKQITTFAARLTSAGKP